MSDVFHNAVNGSAIEPTTPAPEAPPKAKRTRKPAVKAKGKAKVKAKGKGAKRAPRTRDAAKLDKYGFRIGSIRSQAAAMYAKGATLAEVSAALGGVQFNVLTELTARGFVVKETTVKGPGRTTWTRYKITGKADVRSYPHR